MQGIVYICNLFKGVLQCSKSVEGRFFVSTYDGWEINTDQLGELVEQYKEKKYPLAIMLPPFFRGDDVRKATWTKATIRILFLKRTHNNGDGTTQNWNLNTNTSKHTVQEDWHDMHRAALGFLKALHSVIKREMTTAGVFRLSTETYTVRPISNAGNDKVSGVRLEFNIELSPVCNLEDYNTTLLNELALPALDGHPEHKY